MARLVDNFLLGLVDCMGTICGHVYRSYLKRSHRERVYLGRVDCTYPTRDFLDNRIWEYRNFYRTVWFRWRDWSGQQGHHNGTIRDHGTHGFGHDDCHHWRHHLYCNASDLLHYICWLSNACHLYLSFNGWAKITTQIAYFLGLIDRCSCGSAASRWRPEGLANGVHCCGTAILNCAGNYDMGLVQVLQGRAIQRFTILGHTWWYSASTRIWSKLCE